MSFNRCKDIHKFGNKYLPSAYKTQVEFRSHFSGGECVLWSEKYGTQTEICPRAIWFMTKPTRTDLGSGPGNRSEREAIR